MMCRKKVARREKWVSWDEKGGGEGKEKGILKEIKGSGAKNEKFGEGKGREE